MGGLRARRRTRPAGALGVSLAAATAVLVLGGCSAGVETADSRRAGTLVPTPTPLPTATPEPTPTPAPEPTPTPQPTPTPPPSPWPAWVEPLADVVESIRGPFPGEAPAIRTVDGPGMAAALASSVPDLSAFDAETQEAIERFDDLERALGVTGAEYDIAEVGFESGAAIPGLFRPDANELLIRTDDGTAPETLELAAQVVVLHELTHARQGPVRLSSIADRASTDPLLARSIIEGEAEWVVEQWRRGLDAEQRIQLAGTRVASGVEPTLAAAPASVIADFRSAYVLGRRFYEALGSTRGVDSFDDLDPADPALGNGALLDPFAWLDGRLSNPELVGPPAVPADGQALAVVREPIGPVAWLLTLATAVSVEDALVAARAVTSTSVPATWIDPGGRTCLAVEIRHDGTTALDALGEWARRQPDTRSIETADEGRTIVAACDPGVDGVPPVLSDPVDSLRITARILDAEIWARSTLGDEREGRCRALVLLDSGEADQLDDDAWRAALAALDPDICRG